MDDFSERTLEPTQRRLRDARSEGQVARSGDLAAAIALAGAVAIFWFAAMPAFEQFAALLRGSLVAMAPVRDGAHSALSSTTAAFSGAVAVALPVLIATWLIGYAAHVVQVGWLFSPASILPRLSRINPIHGFERMLSAAAAVKPGMDSFKILAAFAVAGCVTISRLGHIMMLSHLEPGPATRVAGGIVLEAACGVAATLLTLGAFDLWWQKWRQRRDLRMNPIEAREELKQSEGDPSIRRRRRAVALRLAAGRRGSPAGASFVIDGGEQALAIQYDPASMQAPAVIARARGSAAERLRRHAADRGVPVVKRSELASALDRSSSPGRVVPPEFYQPLAEILAGLHRAGRITPLRAGEVAHQSIRSR
jgi:flagellar biosynthetic protein FlhB